MEHPYIKPTRRVHDSGYRLFEIGYCEVEGARVARKRVLGECSDHIWVRSMGCLGDAPIESLNIDLTRDGYIRFFVHDEGRAKGYHLKWQNDIALSSSILVLEANNEPSR